MTRTGSAKSFGTRNAGDDVLTPLDCEFDLVGLNQSISARLTLRFFSLRMGLINQVNVVVLLASWD